MSSITQRVKVIELSNVDILCATNVFASKLAQHWCCVVCSGHIHDRKIDMV